MSQKINNSLPYLGGLLGANTAPANEVLNHLPTFEAVVYTIIISALGAFVGYLVKMVLDKLLGSGPGGHRPRGNNDKIEYR